MTSLTATNSKAHSNPAIPDIIDALSNFRLAALLGWQDVAQRYRRSRIGAFWLTINMGVLIGALGLVFGTIFNSPMREFLPFICIGLIFWGYYTQIVSEGCSGFITNGDIILQLNIPFFTYILRVWYRNTVILAHNLVIFPIVLLIFWKPIGFSAFIAVPGFIFVTLNMTWIALVLAILCTRYRDLIQIVQNIMQVMLYVTPIMWMPDHLPPSASHAMLTYNPFFHLVSVVRNPLLDQSVTLLNWAVVVGLAIAGWTFALVLLHKYKARIAYWL
ncbi:ABC transporter permease [Rhizobium sp. BK284]|uniref:ABC transporter permease n=1 Tax=unclassified Rhizobium TaxID=2613769 RepID=UPI0017D963B3|nr:lipopolysaccharide transport system permease protein [Rhizobium sp. BK252]MBB3401504.1 lipopolysaccharide transport system permease protein [Rhizobium sp. BK289]MBB3414082.1 lipopolysaccharide transport system permease protein [Rhizobium sp. BK284]MBB3481969.1 lipopolysaccharide transport system permease protein [Rhizobium sp. BK347]